MMIPRLLPTVSAESLQNRFQVNLIRGFAAFQACALAIFAGVELWLGTSQIGLLILLAELPLLGGIIALSLGVRVVVVGTALIANLYLIILLVILLTGGRSVGAVIGLPSFVILAMILSPPRWGLAWLGMGLALMLVAGYLQMEVVNPLVMPDPDWVKSAYIRVPMLVCAASAVIAATVHRGMASLGQQLNLAQAEAARSTSRVAEFADLAADGFWETDQQLRLCFISSSLARTLGVEAQAVLGLTPEQAFGSQQPDDGLDVSAYMEPLRNQQAFDDQLICTRDRQGRVLWLINSGHPIYDQKHHYLGHRGAVHNITTQRNIEQSLRESEQHLRTIADNLPVLIAYIDCERVFRFNNRTYEQWLNRPLSEITGRRLIDVYRPRTYALIEPYLERALRGEEVSFELAQSDSRDRHVRASYVPHFNLAGEVIGVYGLIHDITPFKQIEQKLRQLSEIDGLTGLANRRRYESCLREAMTRSDNSGQSMGLMFLDLDHFKPLNDSLGHEAGDQALREFAQRMLRCIRLTDTVARLGGDEFVVVLDTLNSLEEAKSIAQNILSAMHAPFEMTDGTWALTASIGIVVRQSKGLDQEDLMRRADHALYVAKQAGRGQYAVANAAELPERRATD